MLTGRTRLYFQLAHPVGHVRVNRILNPIFEARGIDAMVVPLHLLPDEFDATLPRLARLGNVGGFLATVPHKEAIARHCNTLLPQARLCGSANAVRIEADGRLTGEMFDGVGLKAALDEAGFAIAGRRVLLVGAGGAARSIAFMLAHAGAAELVIANRNVDRAAALAAEVGCRASGVADPSGFDLVVNATSLGLKPDDPLPVDPALLAPGTDVCDIVIGDGPTALERAAAARGCRTLGGQPMLDHQFDAVIRFFQGG